jgi:hypothetical protein
VRPAFPEHSAPTELFSQTRPQPETGVADRSEARGSNLLRETQSWQRPQTELRVCITSPLESGVPIGVCVARSSPIACAVLSAKMRAVGFRRCRHGTAIAAAGAGMPQYLALACRHGTAFAGICATWPACAGLLVYRSRGTQTPSTLDPCTVSSIRHTRCARTAAHGLWLAKVQD